MSYLYAFLIYLMYASNARYFLKSLVTAVYETKSACSTSRTWPKPSAPTPPPITIRILFSPQDQCHTFRQIWGSNIGRSSCLTSLSPYLSILSVLLNEKSGIVDDTIIIKHSEDTFYIVMNTGRRDRGLAWFPQNISKRNNDDSRSERGKVEVEVLEGRRQLALQVPRRQVLADADVV